MGDRLHCQENINMEMILIKDEEVKYETECFYLELISFIKVNHFSCYL